MPKAVRAIAWLSFGLAMIGAIACGSDAPASWRTSTNQSGSNTLSTNQSSSNTSGSNQSGFNTGGQSYGRGWMGELEAVALIENYLNGRKHTVRHTVMPTPTTVSRLPGPSSSWAEAQNSVDPTPETKWVTTACRISSSWTRQSKQDPVRGDWTISYYYKGELEVTYQVFQITKLVTSSDRYC